MQCTAGFVKYVVAGVAALMLCLPTAQAAPKAGSVDIATKTSPLTLKEGGKVKKYHVVKGAMDFTAVGPMYLMIVVNLKRDAAFSGTRSLNITRDAAFVSTNAFTIAKGTVRSGKSARPYRPIIIDVPKGSHSYQVGWKDAPGAPLLLRLARAKKPVKAYAAAAEIPVAAPEPTDVVPLIPVPPANTATATPQNTPADVPPLAPVAPATETTGENTEVSPAPAAEATPPPAPEQTGEKAEEPGLKYVSVSARVNVLIPTSRVDTTWAFHADVRYILPWWNPNISIGMDIGYYPTSGSGQNLDPQIGLYEFDWNIHSLPMYFGPQVDVPIPGVPWFYLNAETGFAMIVAWSEGHTFEGTDKASDIAYGYYVGGGVEFRFGKFGGVTATYRHTGIYLDFDYPEFNRELGNLGGSSVLVGYRYIF